MAPGSWFRRPFISFSHAASMQCSARAPPSALMLLEEIFENKRGRRLRPGAFFLFLIARDLMLSKGWEISFAHRFNHGAGASQSYSGLRMSLLGPFLFVAAHY